MMNAPAGSYRRNRVLIPDTGTDFGWHHRHTTERQIARPISSIVIDSAARRTHFWVLIGGTTS
jgi:hypothetical protein